MPVPDDTVFGPDDGQGVLTYADVRSLSPEERLPALRSRLDRFLISQVDELVKERDGKRIVYAPFPLALLTCVGIETLGAVMYCPGDEARETEQRQAFLKVAASLEKGFSRQLSKQDRQHLNALFPKKDAEKIQNAAGLLYYYQRNTLIHGYQSRGVLLTEDQADWKMRKGALIVNPFWLWKRFRAGYDELFSIMMANQEPTNRLRASALRYIEALLS